MESLAIQSWSGHARVSCLPSPLASESSSEAAQSTALQVYSQLMAVKS